MKESFCVTNGVHKIEIIFGEVLGFPDTTTFLGGYDIKGLVNIKAGCFIGACAIWTSTGQMFELYTQLSKINNVLKGEVSFSNYYDDNLKFKLVYDSLGHVAVTGTLYESSEPENVLGFEFTTDQTFISKTVSQLSSIIKTYGDSRGIISR
ncbi:WapI family immunity protein [Mucilaginibacter ginkgonis]|uniref:Uncharacterized protein n=1 Tax=Mucilaginibacter ginkgonis TaxID=2682091 RepID=A0A6I4HYL2_9SPHI|nr:hypothetical protein [Mucilaginibacter ginkgonis]QQL51346.1 hypothetical protein GO620_007850 [Mucilaginibacter ginkgonis]